LLLTPFIVSGKPGGWSFKRMLCYQVILFPLVCLNCLEVMLYFNAYIPARHQAETTIPADILLVHGTCIVNEAMLSGESTPLLKESIQLLEGSDTLDVDGAHKNAVLFSGTKILQATASSARTFLPFSCHFF